MYYFKKCQDQEELEYTVIIFRFKTMGLKVHMLENNGFFGKQCFLSNVFWHDFTHDLFLRHMHFIKIKTIHV